MTDWWRTPEWEQSSKCVYKEYWEGKPGHQYLRSMGYRPHTFRSPRTRSLTEELQCWWCDKTYGQVKAARLREQREKRLAAKKGETA